MDPAYEKLEREVEITTNREPPSFSADDYKTFLTELDISLKKESGIKEYYLEVVFFSQCEVHDDLECQSDAWHYRPDLWGKLVIIDIVSD